MKTTSSHVMRGLRRRSERGFSLVEVLVALVVFAVGALTLVAIVPLGTKKSSAAGQQTLASELTARTVEELLSLPYTDPELDAGNHNHANNPHFTRYYIKWNVEDDQPQARCKRITVTVHRLSLTAPVAARLVVVKPEWGM